MLSLIRLRNNVDNSSGFCIAGGKRGQAMIEYIIVATMLLASVAILSVFLYTFREQSGRVLDLVSAEYP
jgi:hypothetical protein